MDSDFFAQCLGFRLSSTAVDEWVGSVSYSKTLNGTRGHGKWNRYIYKCQTKGVASIPSDSDKTRQQQGRDLHWTDRKHIQNTPQPTHTQLQTRPE